MKSKHSPGRLLQKNRIKVYGKCFMLVESLKQHSAFTAFEPTIGGEFPKAEYDAIITEVEQWVHESGSSSVAVADHIE
jgi:hypothetical protein